MASSQNLSTPKCPAEERVWLAVYQMWLGMHQNLCKAFNKQFGPAREAKGILIHAAVVRDASDEVRTKLLDLAKSFAWYEDPPQEGERGFASMKKFERQKEARDRRNQKKKKNLDDSEMKFDSMDSDVGAAADEEEVSPPPSPKQTTTETPNAAKEETSPVPNSKHKWGSDKNSGILISSSDASPPPSPRQTTTETPNAVNEKTAPISNSKHKRGSDRDIAILLSSSDVSPSHSQNGSASVDGVARRRSEEKMN